MQEIQITNVSRRGFLKTTGALTAGLMLYGCGFSSDEKTAGSPQPLNAFIKITPENKVVLIIHQAEMGQGVQTTLPAILADELDADWPAVKIENGLTDPAFQNPKYKFQFTGNAESVRTFHDILRKMAATAREMLKQAAANKWEVSIDELKTENSKVIHNNSDKTTTFGELVEDASKLPPPENPIVKKPTEWKLVGNKSLQRVDIPEKVKGTALYGIDVERPGMVYAAIEMCPYFGGKIKAVKENNVRDMEGFVDLVRIPVANPLVAYRPGFPKKEGVAVVAETYWQARKALEALEVVYDAGPNSTMDSKSLYKVYESKLAGEEWHEAHKEGDTLKEISGSEATHKATYYSAWQSHAPMEPMNATAEVQGDKVEVWAPTQGQEMAQILLSKELGIPKENITVHRAYLGGGFGRRLLADYIYQAAFISKQVNKPVKVLWSREDDIQHDYYRPGVLQEFTASLDEQGFPKALQAKVVTPSILQAVTSAEFVWEGEDPSILEGIKETPYHFSNYLVQSHLLRIPPPSSVWRSTGYGPNTFALESFIDELAAKQGIDPVEFRKQYVSEERAIRVLDKAAEASAWHSKREEGKHLGVAFTYAFESYIAQVIELSVDQYGVLDIHQITTVVDCGTVLDPAISKASIESGITWGLNAALVSEINFEGGRTKESNFHDFKMASMAEMPEKIETLFVNSGAKIGGIAESGPICVAPALCNAIFSATGERYRTLPLYKHGIYTRYATNYLPHDYKLTEKFNVL